MSYHPYTCYDIVGRSRCVSWKSGGRLWNDLEGAGEVLRGVLRERIFDRSYLVTDAQRSSCLMGLKR